MSNSPLLVSETGFDRTERGQIHSLGLPSLVWTSSTVQEKVRSVIPGPPNPLESSLTVLDKVRHPVSNPSDQFKVSSTVPDEVKLTISVLTNQI